MYPISASTNSTLSRPVAHGLPPSEPGDGARPSGRAALLRTVKAIDHTCLTSIPRALAGGGGHNEEVFHEHLADQRRETSLGPVLSGLWRSARDISRYLKGLTPIQAMPPAEAEAAGQLDQKANVSARGGREKSGGEAAGMTPVRSVNASQVNAGVSLGGLKVKSSHPREFDVRFDSDKRFLSITTSCGKGPADVSVKTLDGQLIQECKPMHVSGGSTACLIDRQDVGNEALERVRVKVSGTRDNSVGLRLNMKALSGDVRRDIKGYGARDVGGEPRGHAAALERRRLVAQQEPSHGARLSTVADDSCVRACPPRGWERGPVLLNDLVQLSPQTTVEVPASFLAKGVRAENLSGRLFEAYTFKLELPRGGSQLHLFTSCSSSPFVFMRLFTPDRQWIDGGSAFGPRRSRSQVAVLDLARADLSGLTHVTVQLNAGADFAGLNFNARIA